MVGVMKIMATSFKRSKASPATLSAPKPAAGRCRPVPPWRLPCTHRHVWASVLWGHGSFLLGPGVHKVLFVLSKGLFPVLCKFWRLYGGVNGDLLHRSHARTATLSAPNPAAGHCQPTPPPETPGLTQASLGQSLVASLLFSSGS